MSELLPCPFCGEDRASYVNTNSISDAPNSDDGYINCNACNSSYGEILPYEEATKAWNTRAKPTSDSRSLIEALGNIPSYEYKNYCGEVVTMINLSKAIAIVRKHFHEGDASTRKDEKVNMDRIPVTSPTTDTDNVIKKSIRKLNIAERSENMEEIKGIIKVTIAKLSNIMKGK